VYKYQKWVVCTYTGSQNSNLYDIQSREKLYTIELLFSSQRSHHMIPILAVYIWQLSKVRYLSSFSRNYISGFQYCNIPNGTALLLTSNISKIIYAFNFSKPIAFLISWYNLMVFIAHEIYNFPYKLFMWGKLSQCIYI
jgi:hypothetical protein